MDNIVQSIVSGLLAGGSVASTAVIGLSRNTFERIKKLETIVGQDGDPPTGLYLMVHGINEKIKGIKYELSLFSDDHPPEYLIRTVKRIISSNSLNLEQRNELENLLDHRLKSYTNSIRRLEEKIDALDEKIESLDCEKCCHHDPSDNNDQSELAIIKDQLTVFNSALNSIITALNNSNLEQKKQLP
jgi:hypothetical protein